MRNKTAARILVLYSIFLISGSLYGLGEKTLVLGAASTWSAAETRIRISEMARIRPHPVLALLTGGGESEPGSLDMALSFDETRPESFADQAGHYRVSVDPALAGASPRLARTGAGAVFFPGYTGTGEPVLVVPRTREALLSEGRHIGDFSVEFWLYPMNMETGEQILSWTSTGRTAGGEPSYQRIQCAAARNRLRWTFQDFFAAPDNSRRISLSFDSSSPVLPKAWSHHLIRFNADTGLFEYLINGRLETLAHTTSSGREGGEVYAPIIGRDSRLVMGGRFAGFIDEFRVHRRYVETPGLNRYPAQGGRMETRPVDLGENNSAVLRIEAFGGRTSGSGGVIQNEYTGNGKFRFSDGSEMRFFIRTGDNPYRWTEEEWRSCEPGTDIPENLRGRFMQLAAVFYPSGDGETTPYLDEIRVVYAPDAPPNPPSLLAAAAGDGAVDLSWRASPDEDTAGYMVYYGTSRGEYFGDGAILGPSPINAGKRTSLRIDGLKNGTLYYFAVAAYDHLEPFHGGEFSREVSARPVRMAE
jgi:hypothetical protein